jgi:Ni/Fe-hydrogenase 1 B-type cytochrome subunit
MAVVAPTSKAADGGGVVLPVEDDSGVIGSRPVYVWEVPVRVTHWTIVISIVGLALTGLYIHSPFLVPSQPVEASQQMASVRFWHEMLALVFSISIAVRFYWGFVGNSFSSWRQIVPHRREQFYWMSQMFRYYTFRRRHPVPYTGHNHLAGLAYSIVSVGLFAQVITGMLLFGWLMPSGPIHALFGWSSIVPGGIMTVRVLHYILTFLFVAFMIHHVYSAILVDIEERVGVMSSIFSGYKNIRQGQTIDSATGVDREPPAKGVKTTEQTGDPDPTRDA